MSAKNRSWSLSATALMSVLLLVSPLGAQDQIRRVPIGSMANSRTKPMIKIIGSLELC